MVEIRVDRRERAPLRDGALIALGAVGVAVAELATGWPAPAVGFLFGCSLATALGGAFRATPRALVVGALAAGVGAAVGAVVDVGAAVEAVRGGR